MVQRHLRKHILNLTRKRNKIKAIQKKLGNGEALEQGEAALLDEYDTILRSFASWRMNGNRLCVM